jgi:hypothetical protein
MAYFGTATWSLVMIHFDPTLAVGDEQSMTFSPTDFGPFWMDAAEREERRFDRPKTNAAAPQPRNKSKKDLAAELSVPGNVLDPNKFKLEQLQEMASAQEIPLQKIVPSIDPGWVGKQKGLYQVLWERGWIDTSRLDERAITKKDDRALLTKNLDCNASWNLVLILPMRRPSCRQWEKKWELVE